MRPKAEVQTGASESWAALSNTAHRPSVHASPFTWGDWHSLARTLAHVRSKQTPVARLVLYSSANEM